MKDMIFKSIGAGIMISLGGFMYLSVQGGLKGAVLFSIGLLVICITELNLYTGQICYVFDRKKRWWFYPAVLAANLLTTALIGLLLRGTPAASAELRTFAETLAQAKLNKSALAVFINAVFCNLFIFVAVDCWKKRKDTAGALIIVLSVVGFIITGSEHCIADCFYFAVAGSADTDTLIFMILCILGNSVGGILGYFLIGNYIPEKKAAKTAR